MFLNFQCKLNMPPVIPLACSWGLELYSASFDQLNCTLKSAKMVEVNNKLVSMCTDVLSMCKVCVEVRLSPLLWVVQRHYTFTVPHLPQVYK